MKFGFICILILGSIAASIDVGRSALAQTGASGLYFTERSRGEIQRVLIDHCVGHLEQHSDEGYFDDVQRRIIPSIHRSSGLRLELAQNWTLTYYRQYRNSQEARSNGEQRSDVSGVVVSSVSLVRLQNRIRTSYNSTEAPALFPDVKYLTLECPLLPREVRSRSRLDNELCVNASYDESGTYTDGANRSESDTYMDYEIVLVCREPGRVVEALEAAFQCANGTLRCAP
jgi:hypothetical protein